MARPREARVDRAILTATRELIGELGVHDFRVDDVVRRAGVGKGAIYRRYRSKDELVTAAVAAFAGEVAVPDTGSTRTDLMELMRNAAETYTDSTAAGVISSLVGAMRQRPELAGAVRDGFFAKQRDALREALGRGVARGDVRADLDVELTLDVLGGALVYRLLVMGDGRIDDGLAEGLVDLAVHGLVPPAIADRPFAAVSDWSFERGGLSARPRPGRPDHT